MSEILLSICIPTYNRSGYLKRALESILVQLEGNPLLQKSVEIVVSDNCSTDDTARATESYKPKIKNLKYVASEKNVGFDLNVLNVVRNASGNYCWYLGDDDVIVNGGIEFMCACLTDKKYDFVGVNSEHLIEGDEGHKKKRTLSRDSVVVTNDFNEFYFKDYCQGGVSVLIFDRNLWLSVVDPEDFLQHWLYYETVLKILVATKKPMAFVEDTAILTGQDCRWAENGVELFTFGNSNLLLERMILFGFDKKRVTDTLTKNSRKTPIILLRAKGHDLKCNLANLKYIYKNLKRIGPARLALVTVIYFIPNFLVKFARDARKGVLNGGAAKN